MKTAKTVKSKTSKTTTKPAAISAAKVNAAPASATKTPAVAPRHSITSEIIAARAYTIWEQKGRPQGNELENWLLAESQIKRELQSLAA